MKGVTVTFSVSDRLFEDANKLLHFHFYSVQENKIQSQTANYLH